MDGTSAHFVIQSDLSITRFLGVPDFCPKIRVIERSVLYRGFENVVEGLSDAKLLTQVSKVSFVLP